MKNQSEFRYEINYSTSEVYKIQILEKKMTPVGEVFICKYECGREFQCSDHYLPFKTPREAIEDHIKGLYEGVRVNEEMIVELREQNEEMKKTALDLIAKTCLRLS